MIDWVTIIAWLGYFANVGLRSSPDKNANYWASTVNSNNNSYNLNFNSSNVNPGTNNNNKNNGFIAASSMTDIYYYKSLHSGRVFAWTIDFPRKSA